MDEEVIDFSSVDDGRVMARLKQKAQSGYQINVVIKKMFNITNY
jgi:hypothetical protein